MVICPLGTYYCSIDRFFGGSATYAAASAAGMANVILAAFVVTAIMEDSKENKAKQKDQ